MWKIYTNYDSNFVQTWMLPCLCHPCRYEKPALGVRPYYNLYSRNGSVLLCHNYQQGHMYTALDKMSLANSSLREDGYPRA